MSSKIYLVVVVQYGSFSSDPQDLNESDSIH